MIQPSSAWGLSAAGWSYEASWHKVLLGLALELTVWHVVSWSCKLVGDVLAAHPQPWWQLSDRGGSCSLGTLLQSLPIVSRTVLVVSGLCNQPTARRPVLRAVSSCLMTPIPNQTMQQGLVPYNIAKSGTRGFVQAADHTPDAVL